MTQGIQEQRWVFPAVEAESHFVQVGCEMLRANSVPRSEDATLEQRERRFYSVGMNIPLHVHLVLMTDRFMGFARESGLHHCQRIAPEFIGHDYVHILTDVLSDELCQRSGMDVSGMEETEIAATLTDANYDLFLILAELDTLTCLLSADVGFVHLDGTSQQGLVYFSHGGTNAVAEVPRRFIAHSQSALHLVCREAFSGLYEQQDGHKPLAQGQVRVIEDGSSGDGKLIVALGAIEQLAVKTGQFVPLAPGALWGIGPAQPFQDFAAFFIGREQFGNFGQSHREHLNG